MIFVLLFLISATLVQGIVILIKGIKGRSWPMIAVGIILILPLSIFVILSVLLEFMGS